MSPRRLTPVIAVLVALAPIVAGCSSGDDGDEEATPTPTQTPFGDGRDAPPASPGQLPPEFMRCMADQGYDVESSADVHSAPPQVLQACFTALHEGGG